MARLDVGTEVRIIDPKEGIDPYIFQFQQTGVIVRPEPGWTPDPARPRKGPPAWMIWLDSAVGEWRARAEILTAADRSDWRTGDWH